MLKSIFKIFLFFTFVLSNNIYSLNKKKESLVKKLRAKKSRKRCAPPTFYTPPVSKITKREESHPLTRSENKLIAHLNTIKDKASFMKIINNLDLYINEENLNYLVEALAYYMQENVEEKWQLISSAILRNNLIIKQNHLSEFIKNLLTKLSHSTIGDNVYHLSTINNMLEYFTPKENISPNAMQIDEIQIDGIEADDVDEMEIDEEFSMTHDTKKYTSEDFNTKEKIAEILKKLFRALKEQNHKTFIPIIQCIIKYKDSIKKNELDGFMYEQLKKKLETDIPYKHIISELCRHFRPRRRNSF